MLEQVPGDGTVPELIEAGGVPGQGGFEVVADLAVEGRAFADEVAAVANEQLQGGPGFVPARFQQGAPGDCRAVQGGQIGIVGFVGRIDGLPILLGHERVDDPGLETSGHEGALHDAMIATGSFNGDQAIAQLVVGKGLPNLGDGRVECGTVMGHPGRGIRTRP